MYLSNLATSQLCHFECLSDLSDLENSILHLKVVVEFMGNDHPNKAMYLSNIAISQIHRFNHLGDLSDLENAILHQNGS